MHTTHTCRYILNISRDRDPQNDSVIFNLLPDEFRDRSNLSNPRTRDFVWIVDDVAPTFDVICDAFSNVTESDVRFVLRNSKSFYYPESMVTLTEQDLIYDRDRLQLVELTYRSNPDGTGHDGSDKNMTRTLVFESVVYTAKFRTSYQLVPFT